MFSSVGRVGPAYCTGVGKAMLAFLPDARLEAALARQSFHAFTPTTLTDTNALRAELRGIRAEGLARDREEHEPGIACVAAPIVGRDGTLYGAVSISAATHQTPPERLELTTSRLREAAAAIAADAEVAMAPAL